jgi:asparagine synthase (glutamine-hydrolysing)
MCGIAGCFDVSCQTSGDRLQQIAAAMAAMLVHRGPDESGVWCDPSHGIALAHRRLSILDLSPTGSQPMHSPCGRFTIVFNGEIYNHAALRLELEGHGRTFRGHCDTEVLMAAIREWGVAAALPRLNGMFAFAIWDRDEQSLTLARDRLGIKPLYWGLLGRQLVFASELKGLRVHPDFRAEIDRYSLTLLLQHSYVPTPWSIYCGIQKLSAGCVLTITRSCTSQTKPVAYWSLREVIARGQAEPFPGSEADAIDQLDALLRNAVSLQRLADVRVGAFLSGGVDSSVVTALMQARSSGAMKAFTIGFAEADYDESHFAEPIARHLGVDYTCELVTPSEAQGVIPQLPAVYDEPFADSSQIPTLLVSQLARRHVTVSLSGDGGDELFGGYERYARTDRIWRQIAWLPHSLRKHSAKLYQQFIHTTLLGRNDASLRARVLSAAKARQLYEELHRHWVIPQNIVVNDADLPANSLWDGHWLQCPTFVEEMMALDTTTYLPDCILTKLDRASMAVSLEARVPLLDHRVVEFAWTLPSAFKFNACETKRPLRLILERCLPRSLFERPKRGFGVPIGEWLRGPLRDWAESLLSAERLKAEGFLQPQPIREKWQEHLAGRANWQYLLWDVLMIEAWHEEHVRSVARA